MLCPFCGNQLTTDGKFVFCKGTGACNNFIETDDMSYEEVCISQEPDSDEIFPF